MSSIEGSDYGLAILEYAKLEKSRVSFELAKTVLTFEYVASLYMDEIVPTKAPATQKGNARELKQLLVFFNDPPTPLEAIERQHVRQYLRYRSKQRLPGPIVKEHCSAQFGTSRARAVIPRWQTPVQG